MNKPNYVKVGNKKYKINTDFRVAIECERVIRDKSISDYERVLAFIYLLFGEAGLDCEDGQKLIEMGLRYILLGKTKNELENEPRNNKDDYKMDILKCEGLIRSSFKFDYNYDPYELDYLHWWDFYNDLENLSTSEFGTCCAYNRVTGVLNQNPREIKESKDRTKLIEAQKLLRKKYCKEDNKEKELNEKEKGNVANLYKQLGLWKEA